MVGRRIRLSAPISRTGSCTLTHFWTSKMTSPTSKSTGLWLERYPPPLSLQYNTYSPNHPQPGNMMPLLQPSRSGTLERMMRGISSPYSTSHWEICCPPNYYKRCSAWITVAPASYQTASSGDSTSPNCRHQCNHYLMLWAATRATTTTLCWLTRFSRGSQQNVSQ